MNAASIEIKPRAEFSLTETGKGTTLIVRLPLQTKFTEGTPGPASGQAVMPQPQRIRNEPNYAE